MGAQCSGGQDMKTFKIGFDIGGILSKFPEAIAFYRACLASPLMEVHIVTDMPKDKALAMLALNSIEHDVAHVHSGDYAEHGEESKAEIAKTIGLDALVDDFISYVATPGAPALRLLAMPDPTRDYYHPTWKTDGTEGNFGRRRKRGGKRETPMPEHDFSPAAVARRIDADADRAMGQVNATSPKRGAS